MFHFQFLPKQVRWGKPHSGEKMVDTPPLTLPPRRRRRGTVRALLSTLQLTLSLFFSQHFWGFFSHPNWSLALDLWPSEAWICLRFLPTGEFFLVTVAPWLRRTIQLVFLWLHETLSRGNYRLTRRRRKRKRRRRKRRRKRRGRRKLVRSLLFNPATHPFWFSGVSVFPSWPHRQVTFDPLELLDLLEFSSHRGVLSGCLLRLEVSVGSFSGCSKDAIGCDLGLCK